MQVHKGELVPEVQQVERVEEVEDFVLDYFHEEEACTNEVPVREDLVPEQVQELEGEQGEPFEGKVPEQ